MSKEKSKHIKKKNNKHYNKSWLKLAFVIVLIFTVVILITKHSEVKTNYNSKTKVIYNNEDITSKLNDDILIENNEEYMSTDDIKNLIDNNIYLEESTNTIITTGDKKLAAININDNSLEVNGSEQKVKNIVIDRNDKRYIDISELDNVYDYEYTYIKETNIITMDSMNKKLIKTYALKNLNIKESKETKSRTIEKVSKGNWLIYIEENDGFAKVRTQNGNIGFVKGKYLGNSITVREDFEEEQTEGNTNFFEYDITKKDISTYKNRLNIMNLILQEAIKNDNMCVKIINQKEENLDYERFKIESKPELKECGIMIQF